VAGCPKLRYKKWRTDIGLNGSGEVGIGRQVHHRFDSYSRLKTAVAKQTTNHVIAPERFS
jgi:hypothetical protein